MKGTYGAVEAPAPDLAKPIQGSAGEGFAQDLLDKQKTYFATDITKTYEWRIDQLDRPSCMLTGNNDRFSEASRRDFKTALPENMNIGFLLLRLIVELILASRGTQRLFGWFGGTGRRHAPTAGLEETGAGLLQALALLTLTGGDRARYRH
jgi:hypothetical protein